MSTLFSLYSLSLSLSLLPYFRKSEHAHANHGTRSAMVCFLCIIVEGCLLLGLNLHDAFHKVFVQNFATIASQRQHTSLHTNCFQHGSVEIFRRPGQLFIVHIFATAHFSRVNLKNSSARTFVGMRELDLSIYSPTAKQCGIQNIHTIGGCNHFDSIVRAEAIQLVQQLQHSSLHFSITRKFRIKSLGPYRIQFINKDNGGCLLLGKLKGVTHQFGTITDEHLH
mmetsp:Transcript_11332/g.19379  ORF Transcript_11332/g.19379 Transcript_11332/m.19379 type:complete len:224 (-) Transcript_11332:601-1272(-)